jgi:hypothetical protein
LEKMHGIAGEARRKLGRRNSKTETENRKHKLFSGADFERRWRRLQATKLVASNTKVVAHTLSFPTVRRTQAGVACAGGEIRRNMAPRSSKNWTIYQLVFVSISNPTAFLPRI